MTDEQYKKITSAAEFFNETARKFLTTERGLHAETLISSLARMSGSLMYRSFGFDEKIEPGTAVLSDKANIEGPKLMNWMYVTLRQLGHNIGEENTNRSYASAEFSQLNFKESHDHLAAFFLAYCKAASLSFQDAAVGASIATAIIIHDCRNVLAIEKGAAIAIYGFVEGTKTAPYSTDQRTPPPAASSSPTKKPWYKIW